MTAPRLALTSAASSGPNLRGGLRVLLVTPAPRGTRYGNRVTALRWARLLRNAGHRVAVATEYTRQQCDVMIGLHARRSASSMAAFKERHPEKPLVLCLTGTDVYQDIRDDTEAQRSMELADRIVVLQPLAVQELAGHLHAKTVPIIQSARPTRATVTQREDAFEVCVVGHMRPVKDPFRLAMAARLLPKSSQVRVLQVGGAMTAAMASRAEKEMTRSPRYRWLGELPAWRARRVMKRSRVMVISSVLEGGANVVCEALADGVPVIGSRIPGNVGLLGENYPGYYTPGATRELAQLLRRVEAEPAFLEELRLHCQAKAPLVRPEAEQAAWDGLLREVAIAANDV